MVIHDQMNREGKTRSFYISGLQTPPEIFTESLVQLHDLIVFSEELQYEYNTEEYLKRKNKKASMEEGLKTCYKNYMKVIERFDEKAAQTLEEFRQEDPETKKKMLKNSQNPYAWSMWDKSFDKKDKKEEEDEDEEEVEKLTDQEKVNILASYQKKRAAFKEMETEKIIEAMIDK